MKIKVDDVSKQFGHKQILKEINLELEPNRIYGLLGRNGAGKSTLLNILTDRIFPNGGSVTMDGEAVHENDKLLGKMYLMSEVNLYQKRARLQDLFQASRLMYGGFDDAYAKHLCDAFELNPKLKFGQLSTGYRTIFKLIIALSLPVDFVFLDEPILGLDANHRELFYKELLDSYSQHPRTFVISTHMIEEVANMIEHVFVIEDGKILVDDDVDHMLAQAYVITGPGETVDSYTEGLNVIGSESLGNLKGNYVFGKLNDTREIPDTVQISRMDLQKLFIHLTSEEGQAK
ncbi:ABC transporter, ATP-binding protein [Pediococcus damnosus]|uniref:ABC transporter, ATP-binding protein n=1 Tax=Pediococcus damnosus TaxID=51663 RepID=A0A0R2H340_9LACO|nr:ABC transporter ATP-binding protein [Pediococcus damnosus]AMV61226.1 ABC transporter, ATP-binding protein [Pediococcus damnosus]AMV62455.1 ABC transporter, ATP-binding protein [Pediococcus damnosus]AMV65586.1 ABC transporter, ATP-binding protein [Pediococcus damnosus]AMV67680.1 ABC transporter, ATP-binding protein [Pediococcus damnosus]AMV68993.1 ABC transporter, ATP-binding protein [Pediococcus damnosus]